MLRITDTYATVWHPELKEFSSGGKVVNANISTSEKNTDQKTGEVTWRNSNWNNAAFVGKDCVEAAADLETKDRIIIKRGGVRMEKYTDKTTGKDKYATKLIIFEFEKSGGNNGGGKSADKSEDEKLPF